MPVTPARRIAYKILRRVETEGAYASDLLYADTGGATADPGIKSADVALATELTLGVLRWRRLLDFLLERQLNRPLSRLDLEVLIALRLGLYQLRFLERVPARAAVNESVELVKQAKKTSAASLVNAVLRRADAESRKPAAELINPNLSVPERLGVTLSHPTWMVERWLKIFGEAKTTALLQANNRAPNLTCAIHAPEHLEEILAELREQEMKVEPGRLLRSAILVKGGSPSRTDAFRRGWISIQDEASQLVPQLLGVRRGNSVLDLCAAPGGKTILLAQAAGPQGSIVAADRYEQRLDSLRKLLERCRIQNVKIVQLDAERPLPFARQFNRILVDAPCSGTGTLARNPEIRWRLKPEDLAAFHKRQVMILWSGLRALAPGGQLVYSTCSLEPEENESVSEEAVQGAADLRIVQKAREKSIEDFKSLLADGVDASSLFDIAGTFRTFPPSHHADGFFAAILERFN